MNPMQGSNQTTIIHVQTRKVSVRGSTPSEGAECRICLSGAEQDNPLISPCACTGSVQFIHIKCFHAWIRKKAEDPLLREQILSPHGLDCEICHQRYQYTYEITTKCANFQIFKRKLVSRKFMACATLLFIMVDLVLLGIMLAYAISDQRSPEYDIKQPRFFLVYIALGFALISVFYGFSQFGKLFLIYQTFELLPVGHLEKQRIKIVRGYSNETANINDIMQDSHLRMQNSNHFPQYI